MLAAAAMWLVETGAVPASLNRARAVSRMRSRVGMENLWERVIRVSALLGGHCRVITLELSSDVRRSVVARPCMRRADWTATEGAADQARAERKLARRKPRVATLAVTRATSVTPDAAASRRYANLQALRLFRPA